MSELSFETVLEVPIKPNPHKNPVGRPKIPREKLELLIELLAHGLTEDKCAQVLGINRATIYEWKKQREFSNAIMKAKDVADQEVVKSLYLSAVGFTHPEEKVFCHDGEIIVHKTTKHYPPNAASMAMWLTNRQREHWRKEIQHEENRPDTKPPMIRLFSKIDGKEAAAIQQTGNQLDVLLGSDFVVEIEKEQKQNGRIIDTTAR